MRPTRRVVTALAVCLFYSPAFADAPCDKGVRDTTPAERNTIVAVLEVARRAMPPAPQGWIILGDDQPSVPASLCQDFADRPLSYAYSRHYQRVDDAEARAAASAAAAAEFNAALTKKQPRLDALQAKMADLMQATMTAIQKGDNARAEALNKEIEDLQRQYEAVLNEGDSKALLAAVGRATGSDVEMSIQVQVNPASAIAPSDAVPISTPAGASSAHRWVTEHEGGVRTGNALVTIGPVGAKEAGSASRAAPPGDAAISKARAIAVTVNAADGRLDDMLRAIDYKALAGVLTH